MTRPKREVWVIEGRDKVPVMVAYTRDVAHDNCERHEGERVVRYVPAPTKKSKRRRKS